MTTKKIDDGGLAFPGKRWQQVCTVADYGFSDDDRTTYGHVDHPGMSLRDWFAGQALAGNLSAENMGVDWIERLRSPDNARLMADRAYQMADAMLAARKAGEA